MTKRWARSIGSSVRPSRIRWVRNSWRRPHAAARPRTQPSRATTLQGTTPPGGNEMMTNMEQSSAALIEHLKRLERRQAELQRTNRRLGSVIGAIVLITGALVLMGQTSQPQ